MGASIAAPWVRPGGAGGDILDAPSKDAGRTLALSPFEASRFGLQMLSIGAVTYFTQQRGAAIDLESHLRTRVKQMISFNPWLGGTLVRKSGQLVLEMSGSEEPADVSNFFTSVVCPRVFDVIAHPETNYADFLKCVNAYRVPSGFECIKKSAPLFRCTLVRKGPDHDGTYAIVVSLAHVLGDGATFYELYSMLSTSPTAVRALSPRRIMTFEERRREAIGESEERLANSPGILANILWNLWRRQPPSVFLRDVNQTYIDEQKLEHKSNVAAGLDSTPFVSTNDILVSWFLRRTSATIGSMALNFRGRAGFEDLTGDVAGNYVAGLVYMQPDFASPALVRQSLSGLRRCAEPPSRLPGLYGAASARLSLVTSWKDLYLPLDIDGFDQLLHLPMIGGRPFHGMMCLFYARPNRLAMLLCVRGITASELAAEGPVGDDPRRCSA